MSVGDHLQYAVIEHANLGDSFNEGLDDENAILARTTIGYWRLWFFQI